MSSKMTCCGAPSTEGRGNWDVQPVFWGYTDRSPLKMFRIPFLAAVDVFEGKLFFRKLGGRSPASLKRFAKGLQKRLHGS